MNQSPISPNGIPITVRPIEPEELDRIVLRCWPDRDALDRLFIEQGTIGMAAWEGDKCVGMLHCYRVVLPDGSNEHWPEWNNWWSYEKWSEAARQAVAGVSGAAWCHACIHVGRTLESAQEEFAGAPGIRKGTYPRYFGRGIGTALCQESIRWAREHSYAAVLAPGAPDGLFEFAIWAGGLPWTTYAKLGFEAIAVEGEGVELPEWAQGNSPPEVMAEVRAALAEGRRAREFHGRLMVLSLVES